MGFSKRNIGALCVYLLVTCLTISASLAVASEGLGELHVKRLQQLPVQPSALAAWKDKIFEGHEIWAFDDKEVFFDLLRAAGLSDELYQELNARAVTEVSDIDFAQLTSLYRSNSANYFLSLPTQLKNQLSSKILQAAYSHLVRTHYAPPFLRFTDVNELGQFTLANFNPPLRPSLMKSLIEIDGVFHLFYTPGMWSQLNDSAKMDFILARIKTTYLRAGLDIELMFTRNDDIAGIARRYSGERDPRPLERYLKQLLAKSPNGKVQIPLERILHPFIRKSLNTYEPCSGANCMNSGLSVNRGHFYERQFVSDYKEFLHVAYANYRFVESAEPLQTGDVLVYQDGFHRVIHVSNYITDEIVYTKNGVSKFSPYIFQAQRENEAIYFPSDKFLMMALRLPKNGTPVIRPADSNVPLNEITEIYHTNTYAAPRPQKSRATTPKDCRTTMRR